MAPKKPEKEVDVNAWRTAIENARLNEEDWHVKVIFIEAAGSDQDRKYLNKFETFAAEEKRFVVKNICKTETVFMVNQLGAEKKVKDESLRVFEEGNIYLKDKKDIPAEIFALIIKHLILKMKDEYLFIKDQRLEVTGGMKRESHTMIQNIEVKGTVNGQPQSAQPSQVEISSQSNKKFNTSLRERGEEWRDRTYVDDYPIDGPNLYVALTGFVEPFLPGCLIKIGIPLSAIVQVRIDPNLTPLPPSLTRGTKRCQSYSDLLAGRSLHFWDILQSLRIQKYSADDFKNTAFIIFYPPYWEYEKLSGDPDKIYDELCFLMYDVQDLSRQHLHYLNNMDIISIPGTEFNENYIKYYHQVIDDIPLECVTIYSILDSILTTVCNKEITDEESRSSMSTTATTANAMTNTSDRNEQSAFLVKEVFNTLCKTQTNKKEYRTTFGDEYENQKDPIVIDYGDFSKYNTFHLGNINLDQIVFSSLFGLPIHNLWRTQDRLKGEVEAKVNFHVNVLLSCFERQDVETSELNRLLHILACRKLYNNRSSLKKSHLKSTKILDFKKKFLKRSVLAEPLPTCPSINLSQDNIIQPSINKSEAESELSSIYEDSDTEESRIKMLFDCPDISDLVSAVEIANNKPYDHMIDNFDYFEDFNGICAFQIMYDAFQKFNCVDYKYCEVTDSFILMCFNSHDEDGIARDEWRCHLCTPLCLQDFFDFVFEEQNDWIQNEELVYDENQMLIAKSDTLDNENQDVLDLCLEDRDVAADLLMEGSLKEAEQQLNEAAIEQVSSFKSKPSVKSSTKAIKSSEPPSKSVASVKPPAKPFLGYDLSDRRVEVIGKDGTFFSKDGTKVSSKYSLLIPLNLEYIIMNITPGNRYNEFWLHRALGEFVTPEIIDSCESFRITGKDQVMINIKKQTYRTLIPGDETYTSTGDLNPPQFEIFPFYKLFLTWPNGMITETIYEDNSSVLSHIKQYHVCDMPNRDEVMRCISLNGEVIIFKASDDIEVLKPDGSYIKIVDYYKRIVIPEEPEERPDEVFENTKKGKEKHPTTKPSVKIIRHEERPDDGSENTKKTKERNPTTKASVKNVKPVLSEVPAVDIIYELVIDGFEMIDTSGLRQQYVKDVSFDLEKLLVRTATDYYLGEIFSKRMDGTTTLLNKDGVFIVTFPNKTRIISYYVIGDEEIYPEWTDEEKFCFDILESEFEVVNSKLSVSQSSISSDISHKIEEEEPKEKPRKDGYISITMIYTIEHCNFSTITINKFEETVSIESPNKMSVLIDKNNHYNFSLDDVTTAEFDSEYLNISYAACLQCKSYTTCNVNVRNIASNNESIEQGWVKVQDSYNTKVIVDDEGAIDIVDNLYFKDSVQTEEQTEPAVLPEQQVIKRDNDVDCDGNLENVDEKIAGGKSESSVTSHEKCREKYLAKTIRFFTLKRDLSCSELVHRALLQEYQDACHWQPWCSINKNKSFGDHRSTISILTPIHLTETEKWLMDSKLADKPKYLTYKDLKKDTGKRWYHWMRPYKRFVPKPYKPENELPPRLPRAWILRTLEEQWDYKEKPGLKGAKELLRAVLKYRSLIETDRESLLNIPILDPRSSTERHIDDCVQNLGHKIYRDLKERLEKDIQDRVTATITTKPVPPSPEEISVEGEHVEEHSEQNLQAATESVLNQAEEAEPMSPNLAKYWRRRAEELKEQHYLQQVLREGRVPPYFQNKTGAIWWAMHDLANKAVQKAERRKLRCVCAEEEIQSTAMTN